jgi:murein DD-endopeptidase MepM/ murein hydrolase activator NlpD
MRIVLIVWLLVQPLALGAAGPVAAKSTAAKSTAARPVVAKRVAATAIRRPAAKRAAVKRVAAKPVADQPPPALPPDAPQIGYPLAEVKPIELQRSEFNAPRRGHRHHAIDLMRPRGTPVMAVTDGQIRKLYRSKTGGISVYLFDASEEYCFFYAHLDHYAEGLHEGQEVHKGDVIAYVGYTGNAKRNAPHLHFAVSLTGAQRKWSGGIALDPYPMLVIAAATPQPDTRDSEVVASVPAGDTDDTELPASGALITSAP